MFFAFANVAYALPKCVGSWSSAWDNCFGSYTYADGNKYVGEWKGGKRNGQGTYTWENGSKYIGQFRDNKRDGGFFRFQPKLTKKKASSKSQNTLKNSFERRPISGRKQIQSALKTLRLYFGSIDGIWGPNTQKAILAYADSKMLSVSNASMLLEIILTAKSETKIQTAKVNFGTDTAVCSMAASWEFTKFVWVFNSKFQKYVTEAKRRGLSCGVGKNYGESNTQTASFGTNAAVCGLAVTMNNNKNVWDTRSSYQKYVTEAKRRGLSCGVDIETKDVSEDTVVKDLSAKSNAALARAALEQRKNASDL